MKDKCLYKIQHSIEELSSTKCKLLKQSLKQKLEILKLLFRELKTLIYTTKLKNFIDSRRQISRVSKNRRPGNPLGSFGRDSLPNVTLNDITTPVKIIVS